VECLRLTVTRDWARIVGAVDIDPSKLGKDLSQLGCGESLRGLRVVGAVADLAEKPDLVFHTSVSSFRNAYKQLEPLVRQGISVVSSCEELLFPQLSEPRLAAKLDKLCRKSGARVIGTGVNPGFVMDFLPLCFTGVSRRVTGVHVQRVVNASTRREPLQRKIGSGLAPQKFRRLLHAGKAGHAGLKESLALVAHTLGWQASRILEHGEAIVATHEIRTKFLTVRKDETCGLHQRVEAVIDGKSCLTLDLKMYLDAEDPHDAIQIEGDPPLDVLIRGGVAGDQATVAALVNTAPRLLRAEPGLKLVTEIGVV
jgi:hypothetical protein